MSMRKWAKAPQAHVETFAAALPDDARVERRQMFGYPCAFVNGNMFCGLHEDNICVRLGEEEVNRLVHAGQARTFGPMPGRVMREYVAIPRRDCAETGRLGGWLRQGLEFALTLPPKAPKRKKKV